MKVVIAADAHFAEFVEQHTDSLLTTAYLLTRDRSAAEEIWFTLGDIRGGRGPLPNPSCALQVHPFVAGTSGSG
jgi:hypothetical protein